MKESEERFARGADILLSRQFGHRIAFRTVELSERLRAEDRAQAILREKELLLRELQHRVKNSMALIAGLAGLESGRAASEETRQVLTKLETRISALATLYDVLFAHGGIGEVDLGIYLERVAEHAAESLGADAMNICIDCEIESLRLDIKRAVPLGLAVNEIVTDCVKYGFTGRESGRIRISLAQRDGRLTLEAEDDGIGWPPGFIAAKADGFGIGLVAMLAQQLDASFVTDDAPGGGARFRLELGL